MKDNKKTKFKFKSFRCAFVGEVSDSGSEASNDSGPEAFDDGYDDDLMGDDEDRKMLEQMTEKEREQVIFDRIEKREVLKTRSVDAFTSFFLKHYS